jgi:iron complex outermembrane recepter protein
MPAEGNKSILNISCLLSVPKLKEKEMRLRTLFLFLGVMLLLNDVMGIQVKKISVRGRVTDEAGSPLAGAAISPGEGLRATISNSTGSYEIDNLRPGIYTLRYSFIGYESEILRIELKGDTVLNVTMTQKNLETGEVIISATRAGEHSPLAYSTLSTEDLKKRNTGQDIPFVLGLTPSLVETSEAGTGIGYTSLRIRGTDANRINVTIDGIPLNDPESQQVFWVDLPDLSSSVDNIQVQRGAGTSSNGAGAFGATVSIQTRSPENEPLASVSSTFGSFNTFKNTITASTGLLSDRFAFMLRLSDLHSDGYVKRTWSDHRSAYLSGVYRSEKWRLQANIILGEEHTGISWWGNPKDSLKSDRRYNPAGEYRDENGNIKYYDNESDNYLQNHYQLLYSLRINQKLNFNAALHYTSGKGYYEEYKDDAALSDYGIGNIEIGDSLISATDLIRRKWMKNSFTGMVWSLKYKASKIDAILGGGLNYYAGDHFGRIIWMRNAGNLEKDYQWYTGIGNKQEMSIYAKADYSPGNLVSLFGDLQFRNVLYRIKGIDDDLKVLDIKHNFNFFNPKTGVYLSINSRQNAFLSFSLAHREPTRTDYTEAAGDPLATPEAETLYDIESGYKYNSGKYAFMLNLYGMYYDKQLVPTGELSSTGYPIMTNVDRSYRAGAEFSASIHPAQLFSWDLSLTLSRNKILDFIEYFTDYNTSDWSSEYRSRSLGTVDIAYSPTVIGSSDIRISPIKKLDIHFISKYVGRQFFDNTMSSDRILDPYMVNNLMLSFNPAVNVFKDTEIQLLVNNIFDSKYENNAYGGNWYEDGKEKTWAYYFPQAGINFMARLNITF